MAARTASITKVFAFEAAHFLPFAPEGHPCGRVHGHSYRVEVTVRGSIDPKMGWVMDFGDISSVMRPLIAQLDHHLLNEVWSLENPTAELLAVWLWNAIHGLDRLHAVTVHETATSSATVTA